MTPSRRDVLIETALKLFNQDGYHATGIDRILAQSGVAKMTLYKHFKSKDALILAVLQYRDLAFRKRLASRVDARATSPKAQLLAVFDVLDEWFGEEAFSGCMFINAAAEYAAPQDPIYVAAGEHKHQVLKYLRELAARAGAASPRELAAGLMLLMEGAIVMAHVAGERGAAKQARHTARSLIENAGL
ncbi:MAG: TetR family transcriptional regulator [Rhodospirillaceae bacterium]|nr:MAG: TetR family transcriptional regulator [Rhodospirillaceae bacterium]